MIVSMPCMVPLSLGKSPHNELSVDYIALYPTYPFFLQTKSPTHLQHTTLFSYTIIYAYPTPPPPPHHQHVMHLYLSFIWRGVPYHCIVRMSLGTITRKGQSDDRNALYNPLHCKISPTHWQMKEQMKERNFP